MSIAEAFPIKELILLPTGGMETCTIKERSYSRNHAFVAFFQETMLLLWVVHSVTCHAVGPGGLPVGDSIGGLVPALKF